MVSRFSIGRVDAGRADILLSGRTISAKHAEIYIDDSGEMFLHDLGSSNGTIVLRNGKKISISSSPVALESLDILIFGGTQFQVDDILSKIPLVDTGSAPSIKKGTNISSDIKMRRCLSCGSVTPLHGPCIECGRAE